MEHGMTLGEALKWADTFGPLQSDPPDGDAPALMVLAAEVRRLTGALKQANENAERFEREWYLRGDAIERAADVARNACEGWNDALMHEGARMAGDAVANLMGPNVM
jgi:hypothetical protein